MFSYNILKACKTFCNIWNDAVTGLSLTQVRDGARVSQDIPDYWDRVQTHSMNIEIKNVNYSDEGHYTLRDRRDRVVSVTRMDLTGGFLYRYLDLFLLLFVYPHQLECHESP